MYGSSKTGLELFAYPTANGLKATICIEELKIPYKMHVVDLLKGEQKDPEYLKINPMGKIPVLVDNDINKVFIESAGVMYYLGAAKDPQHILLPDSPAGAAEVVSWLSFQTSYFAPANVKIFVPLFFGSSTTAESLIAAVEEVRRYWDLLMQRLKASGGWLVDRRYTAADAGFCAAILQETVLLGKVFNKEDYPEVVAWLDAMLAREGVQRGLVAMGPNPFARPGPERDDVARKAAERLAAMGLDTKLGKM